jgi:arabinose-5-phosphate isomerase
MNKLNTAVTAAAASGGQADIDSARRVLETEADGVRAVVTILDDVFVKAIDLLAGVSGRVIVSGMGKSGHIGNKIAATLASTGTPAQFVHPAEASHGDLGMITPADAVLAMSNSGETSELSDLIHYTRRFNIPLIAIVGRQGSTLGTAADATLVLPELEEACPMGLAPTTSTTATLALGDAIAVALLERKGFSASDFRQFHPGGKLGSSLLKVDDLMHAGDDMPLATHDEKMDRVLLTVTEKRLGCAGITGPDGKLIGIVTDGDLRRHMSPDLLRAKASAVMTPAPVTIGPGILAAEAVRIMNERKITQLFILRDEKPLGILHIHDCLRAGVV